MPDLTLFQWVIALGGTMFGAFTKGVTGFALPILMITIMANFLPLDLVLASIIVPTFVSNLWQALQDGVPKALQSTRLRAKFLIVMVIVIFIVANVARNFAADDLLLVVGIIILGVSLLQLSGVRFWIPPRYRNIAEIGVGMIAGGLGGISGTWGPPTVLYLMAIDTEKREQIRSCGIIFGIGAAALWLAHTRTGFMTREALIFSTILLIPMAMGLTLGRQFVDKLPGTTFRKIVLVVLALVALNIIRRSLMA